MNVCSIIIIWMYYILLHSLCCPYQVTYQLCHVTAVNQSSLVASWDGKVSIVSTL